MRVYIITSARYEECYIEEWVKYHLSIGFDKILINDNNPKDYKYQLKNILKEYIDAGTVIVERYFDYHDLPTNLNSMDEIIGHTYTWLYEKYKDEFDWFAKLDIDEFLEINETENNIKTFLSQKKFDNVLSIIIPWKMYNIKNKYQKYYTRLEHNKDRFEYYDVNEYYPFMFKSIIKKTKYINYVGLHYAFFNNYDTSKYIRYSLSDGIDAEIKLFFRKDNEIDGDIIMSRYKQYYNYIRNISLDICINHYRDRSVEEECNKMIKFDVYNYTNWSSYEYYTQLKEQYPEMFEHPRDLYKLYFIDNINNIKEN